ncbi:MAG TPA: DNA methyltransferase [Flavisolibacter sp.]|nr:DNA methyltransferase [Flavisolibacter sp.]
MAISKMPLSEKRLASFSNPDNDPRGPWASVDMTGMTGRATKDQYFEVELPSGKRIVPPKGRSWGIAEATYKNFRSDNRIWFGQKGNSVPRIKNFLSESLGQVVPSFWDIDYGSNDEGSKEVVELFETPNVFDSPKPVSLVKTILSIATNPSDTVVDFFSGSATTAHAVIQLNAEDDGNRNFIAIQLPETLSPDNASQKAAYDFLQENSLPTTLDYIGFERIKRAAAKIKEQYPDKDLDLGFKHFTLVEPNQNTLDKLESFDKAAMIADTSVLDDFGKPTILFTWLNADGYGLNANAEAIDLAGYTAYHCSKHLYLIDPGFSLDSMKALLVKYDAEGAFNPENIVLFGYSFPLWSINEMVEKNLRILNDSEKNLKINYSVRY